MFKLDLEKAEEPVIKLPSSIGSQKKQENSIKKNIYFCFINYAKAFYCVDHNKLENSERDGNSRPPYLPPEKSVCRSRSNSQNGHGTTDCFQIGKGVCEGYILSLCLLTLYAEYIKCNAELDEAQTGIKIAVRNIHSLRYEDDTMLMEEIKEELKSLLMKVKEESEKAGLKLNI